MATNTRLPETVMLDASSFGIDDRYQRNPEERLPALKPIAKNFDPQKFGVITVTKRPSGAWLIIDGAGRCHVYYTTLGRTGKVPCIVAPPMTLPEEARLFVDLNRNRKAVNSGDMFKADVAAKDKTAVAIQGVFNNFGLTIGRKSAPENIASVQSVKSLYTCGEDILVRTLAIKKAVWPEHVVGGGLLEGVGLFIRAVPNLDEIGFRKVLQANLPDTTLAALKDKGGGRMPLKRYIPQWSAVHWADKYNYRRKKQRADIGRINRVATMPAEQPAA